MGAGGLVFEVGGVSFFYVTNYFFLNFFSVNVNESRSKKTIYKNHRQWIRKKKKILFTTHHDFKWAVCMRGLHGRSPVLARKVETLPGGNASMLWLH